MRQMNYNSWYTEDEDVYRSDLEYILKNKIITGNRLIDELEYDDWQFFGR